MNKYNIEIVKVHYYNAPETTIPVGYGELAENIVLPPRSGIVIYWDSDKGYGSTSIVQFQDGTIEIDNECMSKQFIAEVLAAYCDYILTNGVMLD